MGAYFEHYAGINPLLAVPDTHQYMAAWSPRVLTDEDWMPREEFARSEYLNDFLKPLGAEWLMMVRLALDGPELSSIALGRRDGRGRFEDQELALANRLQPHLIRAFQLGERMAASGRLAAGLEQALEESVDAMLLLDSSGRVRHANGAAERLLGSAQGLGCVAGRLCALEYGAGRLLAALIAQAGSRELAERRGGAMALSPPGGRGPPLSVTVAPVQPEPVSIFTHGPAVLVCISRPGPPVSPDPAGEEGAAGLTARERECLTLVADGKTDWEIAVILSLSEATARFHVDNARKKLGAVNRAHAVARLAGLRAL